MKTCEVTYKWTKEELQKALRNHYRSKMSPAIIAIIGIFLSSLSTLFVFVAVITKGKDGVSTVAAIFTAVAVYWLFFRRQVNEWFMTRGFDKNPSANATIHWILTEQRLTQKCGQLSSFDADWKIVSKIVQSSDGFLLYTFPKNMFYWFPFSAFDGQDEVANFKALVAANQIAIKVLQS